MKSIFLRRFHGRRGGRADRKVPIDPYGEAPPPVGVPFTGLRVGNLQFPVVGRSI